MFNALTRSTPGGSADWQPVTDKSKTTTIDVRAPQSRSYVGNAVSSDDRDQSQGADRDASVSTVHADVGSAALLQDAPLDSIECQVEKASVGLIAGYHSSSCASADAVSAEPTPSCDDAPLSMTTSTSQALSASGLDWDWPS